MFNLTPPPNFCGFNPNAAVKIYYRHLPHWRQKGATYFVTFRMADSIPQTKLRELKAIRTDWERRHPPPRGKETWEEYARTIFCKMEHWLDQGYGACYFAERRFADILSDVLLYFQEVRYFVSCYVVMPNHCHLIIQPYADYSLETILQTRKGFSAYAVNKILGKTGRIWQQESFDRIIRDEEHLYRVVQYIGLNPAMAGIPKEKWVRWLHPDWIAAGWCFEDEIDERAVQ